MQIHRLRLHTPYLDQQRVFYRDVLQFPIIATTDTSFTLRAGTTELTFVAGETDVFYHFAFLIPDDSLDEAIDYLHAHQVPLLLHEGAEVVDFGTGRAIYFYDAAGNIGEFIERPSLGHPRKGPFATDHVVCVNEIGVPATETLAFAQQLRDTFEVRLVDEAAMSDTFCWVGDFQGVFIVTQEGRHWLPTQKPAVVNDFWIDFSTQAGRFQRHFRQNALHDWSPETDSTLK